MKRRWKKVSVPFHVNWNSTLYRRRLTPGPLTEKMRDILYTNTETNAQNKKKQFIIVGTLWPVARMKLRLLTLGQLIELFSFSWIVHAFFRLASSPFRENITNHVNVYACFFKQWHIFIKWSEFSEKCFALSFVNWKKVNVHY